MDVKHVATFSTTVFERDVAAMKKAREAVHDRGEHVWKKTGTLDPMVDIRGGKLRVARNSMVRRDGTIELPNGIALPMFAGFDGTGSMAPNIGHAFDALGRLHGILAPLRTRYNVQMATGVVQDVNDRRPVVQFAQFESDTRIADWIRLLTPDKAGGDNTEDYDLLLAYLMLGVQTDITSFYGLKGYALIVGDEIGRDFVTQENVMEHLGLTLQLPHLPTHDICQALLKPWHLFYVQVSTSGSYLIPETTAFWKQNIG